MSKKQKETSAESVATSTCQKCSKRQCGAKALRESRSGYCVELKSFVNRKHKVCDKFKSKKK